MDARAIVEQLKSKASESARHSRGVGSPTDCRCAACQTVSLRSLAHAIVSPDAALAVFRIDDAGRIFAAGLSIDDVQALFELVAALDALASE